MKDRLSRVESGLAAILTTAAIALHYVAAVSMGALWRDEANTVGLATLPTIRDVLHNLQFDSFPAGWILCVRVLASVAGPMNDQAFRIAGLLIGLTLLAMLWLNARVFKLGAPLFSLSLFALSPSVIRWGDSLRAYGAGMALAILMGITIWRFLRKPVWSRFLLASVTAILGVHVLFYNAPIVLSFCIAGVAVTIARREYEKSFAVIGIGLLAACSLLIYVPTIRAASTWNSLATIPDYDLSWFLFKLDEAISPLHGWAGKAWAFAGLTTLWLCIRQVLFRPVALSVQSRTRVLFGLLTLTAVALTQYAFLKTLSYLTQPWYYLTLLAVAAVMIDVIAAPLMTSKRMRVVRIGLAAAAATVSTLPATRYLAMRMTNVDVVARAVSEMAASGDRVVVVPWDAGVSFSRYYTRPEPFLTIPEVAFHRFHRYDLIRLQMEKRDQTEPVGNVLHQIQMSLKNGKAVYLVSDRRIWRTTAPPTILPPAIIPRDGWMAPKYQLEWMRMIGSELRRHAVSIAPQTLSSPTPVGPYENLDLTILRGWRD